MKKKLIAVLSWMFTPALLLGHHLTQHTAFLYVVGLTAVLATLMCVIVVAFALFEPGDKSVKQLEQDFAADFTPVRLWIGGAFTLAIITYLLAVEAYFTTSIYIFGSVISLVTISFFKQGIAEKLND